MRIHACSRIIAGWAVLFLSVFGLGEPCWFWGFDVMLHHGISTVCFDTIAGTCCLSASEALNTTVQSAKRATSQR